MLSRPESSDAVLRATSGFVGGQSLTTLSVARLAETGCFHDVSAASSLTSRCNDYEHLVGNGDE